MTQNAKLIALDWGTTNVRAALLDGSGHIIDQRHGESGVGHHSTTEFEKQFDDLVHGWADVPAIAAGMIGSRQGWREAAYLPCPASCSDLADGLFRFDHNNRAITIVPGLKLETNGRFDVMRGEESQLAGFLSDHPEFDGTIVMPGTHSKWVTIEKGTIVTFQTYMTGELFEALSSHTILRHSVGASNTSTDDFEKTAQEVARSSQSFEGSLFAIRAAQLLQGGDPNMLRNQLSARLISAEYKSAIADGFAVDDPMTLIGDAKLTKLYASVFAAHQKATSCFDGTPFVWTALFDLATKAGLIGRAAA